MTLNPATISQNRAAAPDMSTWLSANAGSGKTRVLTDRVARLLLNGVLPQNILCLTYTKAAAAEMQIRLFKRLGAWAMKPDTALAEDLQRMGVTDIGDTTHLVQARRLFARAIETPGGLRIQTIHSFCASLLRRFPLEAGVSPAFVEMDDQAAEKLCDEVVEGLADGGNVAAVDAVARHYSGENLADLTRAIVGHAEALSQSVSRETVLQWFGAPPNDSFENVLVDVFSPQDPVLLTTVRNALTDSGSTNDMKAAAKLQGHDFAAPDMDLLRALQSVFLTGPSAKHPFTAKTGSFPTKATRSALGTACDALDALMQRVEDTRDRTLALQAADKTVALYEFANAFLPAYEIRKQEAGWLDFDDLINRTRDLLLDPAVADWVLYRLDGSIDHILVDEAQDTSPAQWQVIERLAQEFAAGRGAREAVTRTIFVVGDKKQSIYSFQGADPEGFDRMREMFRDRMENAGQPFQRRELEFSFRSSDAVLRLVDEVFGTVPDARMTLDTRHRAFHETLPGRVDLWPAVPRTQGREKKKWYDPVDIPADDHHDLVLARAVADFIQNTVGTETVPLPDGTRRLVRAGDFLILVRRRSTLFSEIIRACKARGLPVAGADRLKLGGELAVKDVGALLSFLATPEDDLSLAAALRSPLFGWSEGDLYDLAAGRSETYLWPALRRAADTHPDTLALLNDLRGQADYLRPYDLIERLLSRHDGRRKLLARLGPEAEDGIDSLLSQALSYEQREVPSLTGFLTWLETDDVEVKRQLDTAGDQIRVMTVHGAKGLESPVVILPDTARRVLQIRDEIVTLDTGGAVWKTRADGQPAAMKAALDRMRAGQRAEDLRLLYVAMTRAETWLIVAGAGEVGDDGDSWHTLTRRGLETLEADPVPMPTGPGLRYEHLDWARGAVVDGDVRSAREAVLPGWVAQPAIATPRAPILRPSDLGGAKILAGGEEGDDSEAAMRRGTRIHRLLEHLPGVTTDRRRDVAVSLLSGDPDLGQPDDLDALLGEVAGVLDAPDLAWMFAPDVLTEVDVTAAIPDLGGQRINGTIDKLAVFEGHVLAIDFKSNRTVPERPADTPDGLLRQMGAYAAALQQVFPDKRIDTAILWTRLPRLMPLPHEIVRLALQSLPTS